MIRFMAEREGAYPAVGAGQGRAAGENRIRGTGAGRDGAEHCHDSSGVRNREDDGPEGAGRAAR